MTTSKPPLATANVIYFAVAHLLALVIAPVWGVLVGFSGWAWLTAGLIWLFSGLSITAGYHRLWSHRSYQAAWPLKLFLSSSALSACRTRCWSGARAIAASPLCR
jgi:stearoyl-CoA desaturase (Delta-9 desaturase)